MPIPTIERLRWLQAKRKEELKRAQARYWDACGLYDCDRAEDQQDSEIAASGEALQEAHFALDIVEHALAELRVLRVVTWTPPEAACAR